MERMTSLELVAPITDDSWRGRALPTELHPQKLRGNPPASTEVASQQVVKERPPSPVVRSIDRGSAPMRRPVEVRKEKGPDPFGIRASANRAWRVRVYALPSPGCMRSSFRSSCQPPMDGSNRQLIG